MDEHMDQSAGPLGLAALAMSAMTLVIVILAQTKSQGEEAPIAAIATLITTGTCLGYWLSIRRVGGREAGAMAFAGTAIWLLVCATWLTRAL